MSNFGTQGPWWGVPTSTGKAISLRSAIVLAIVVGVTAGAFGASASGPLFGYSTKLVKSNSLAPWMGMWMSTFFMMPIALWLTYTARNDSKIFNKDWYLRAWSVVKSIFVKKV